MQVALSAHQPIRTGHPVTVAQHEHFRRSMAPPPPDEYDDFTADPLIERYARPRKEAQAARVLAILDHLERGGRI